MKDIIKKIILILFCIIIAIMLWVTFDIWGGSVKGYVYENQVEDFLFK